MAGLLAAWPYCFKKQFSGCIDVVDTFDPRLTAVKLDSSVGPILLVCVYMPCDTGDTECCQTFTDICCKINALHSDVDAVHTVIGGDFNCQPGSRFLACSRTVLIAIL